MLDNEDHRIYGVEIGAAGNGRHADLGWFFLSFVLDVFLFLAYGNYGDGDASGDDLFCF